MKGPLILENGKTGHKLGEKMFTKHTSDKGLVSKIYKNSLNSTTNPI